MNIDELAREINALNETDKTELFTQITHSELAERITENNVKDTAQFTQQFTAQLTQELEDKYQSGKFTRAI